MNVMKTRTAVHRIALTQRAATHVPVALAILWQSTVTNVMVYNRMILELASIHVPMHIEPLHGGYLWDSLKYSA